MTSTGTNSARTGTWLGTAAVAAGLVLVAGCTASGGAGTFVSSAELRLVSFDSCAAATQQLRTAALDHVGPWGFGSGGDGVAVEEGDGTRLDNMAGADGAAPPPAPGAERAAPAPGGASDLAGPGFAAPAAPEAPSYSGTNTHESGVDEPDLVKTDGRRIVTITDGTLRVVDAQRRVPTGQISLSAGVDAPYGWQVADLLLHGDRALVLVREGWWGGPSPLPAPVPAPESTGGAGLLPVPPEQVPGPRLLLVDLTGAPRVLSDYQVDGSLIDARAVGPTARVVVRSGPRLDFPALAPQASEGQRLAANRRVVGDADVTDWLPRYQVTTAGRTSTGQVDCAALSRPVTAYSGTSMLTVLTFNLAATTGLGDGDPVSVVADGDTVYGTGASLYVASDQRWRMPAVPDRGGRSEPDERTEIYKFDVSEAGPPRYVAAGAVPGWLINQYAMSEWEGHLRVATTTTTTGDGEGGGGSQSSVYTLAERGGTLVGVGSVGGLGRGERIYSVRFAGPVGYVVTFRETDPLYTLDLRDPAAPAVLGELKITGYSAYLHPIDPGQVLGVGQEADPRGVVQGTQISLFDVSDLRAPRLRAQHHIRYGQSEAEFDPHAFLWWPAERVVVVPLTAAGPFDQGARLSYGALVLRVDGGGFAELGLVTHPTPAGWEHTGQIRRSLVIGDTLWTVSTAGLQANALSTLAPLAWIAFT